ncbi:hypothetical protein NERG_00548 [Nematocida ausubeli]|uniref:Uncharacterized protein n=1 Tax=Nematocida ausubeli (strain ATCC PRA-371 / ERTm2) TaxID=1913371 RepID=H8ZAC7_NEMA1|nr:hypothetical protein NERG_00548 [Nematocida ausubeli]
MTAKEKRKCNDQNPEEITKNPDPLCLFEGTRYNVLDWHKILTDSNKKKHFIKALEENIEEFQRKLQSIQNKEEVARLKGIFLYPLLASTINRIECTSSTEKCRNIFPLIEPHRQEETENNSISRVYSMNRWPRMLDRFKRKAEMKKAKTEEERPESICTCTRSTLSIRRILDRFCKEIKGDSPRPKETENKMPVKNKPIPLLLSALHEVPSVEKILLEEAPARIRARIFREGLSKQARKLDVYGK